MATWDAYDMDPCLGSCGGRGAVTVKYKNKYTGEIISIKGMCDCFGKSPTNCIFQDKEDNAKFSIINLNMEEWELDK